MNLLIAYLLCAEICTTKASLYLLHMIALSTTRARNGFRLVEKYCPTKIFRSESWSAAILSRTVAAVDPSRRIILVSTALHFLFPCAVLVSQKAER